MNVVAGRVIQRDWSIGEVLATGYGNGLIMTKKKQQSIPTTTHIFIQPRYTNIYFIYFSAPTQYHDKIFAECKLFFDRLKIDQSKIPEDPVLGIKIPDDRQNVTLKKLYAMHLSPQKESKTNKIDQMDFKKKIANNPPIIDIVEKL